MILWYVHIPHSTVIVCYLQAEDSKTHAVKMALRSLASILEQCPGPIKLDFFNQNNFIGLFLQENYYKFFADLVSKFGAECKKHGELLGQISADLGCNFLTLVANKISVYNA